MARQTIILVIGRSGPGRRVDIEMRPTPTISPQRILIVSVGVVLDQNKPAKQSLGVTTDYRGRGRRLGFELFLDE